MTSDVEGSVRNLMRLAAEMQSWSEPPDASDAGAIYDALTDIMIDLPRWIPVAQSNPQESGHYLLLYDAPSLGLYDQKDWCQFSVGEGWDIEYRSDKGGNERIIPVAWLDNLPRFKGEQG